MTFELPARARTAAGTAYVARGAGEPLVLVHGVGLRADAWAPQLETFAASHEVIVLDMPGHGESAGLPAGARLEDFVGWLHRTLVELGRGPVNLVGHSMGALVVLGCACDHPADVLRVAALNGVHRRTPAVRDRVQARAGEVDAGVIDVAGPLRRWYGDAPTGIHAAACRASRAWLEALDPAGYANAYRAFAEGDAVYADRLARLACPALYLTGADDPNSTPAMTRAMAEATPNARAVVVPGERHMTSFVAPGPVDAALREWLRAPAGDTGDTGERECRA